MSSIIKPYSHQEAPVLFGTATILNRRWSHSRNPIIYGSQTGIDSDTTCIACIVSISKIVEGMKPDPYQKWALLSH